MGRRRKHVGPSGILVVDKPSGCTSHDVVSRLRRILGTPRVGHCGTLDPMATGVLVIAVGEGTKLVPYLTADDKSYTATIQLGTTTDSLDADGTTTAQAPVPPLRHEVVEREAARWIGTHAQRAPKVSALKVEGERLHAKARRGDDFEAPMRDVALHEVTITALREDAIDLELRVGKGFYVRSFARDLANALGTVGHLSSLRRTASGSFDLSAAMPIEDCSGDKLLPPARALQSVMPCVELDAEQHEDARQGRLVQGLSGEGQLGLTHQGRLVAIAEHRAEGAKVLRGFPVAEDDVPATPLKR